MINNISSAMNAYQTALNRMGAKAPLPEQKPVAATGFQDMVKDSISSVVNISKNSEAMTLQGIQGKADIQDVVLAIANAETALNTVVAVRDTAIKAYQTIIQMQV